MNIAEYARLCTSRLQLTGATKRQFWLLAFDLGEAGDDARPPPVVELSSLNDHPRGSSPSGPWGKQVNQWRPGLSLVESNEGGYKLDKHGEFLVKDHATPSKICSERWLLGGLAGYLRGYQRAHGRMPRSVSLFTVMTPCPKCNMYMRRFPGAIHCPAGTTSGASIGIWNLCYTADYIGYATPVEGDAKTQELASYGWRVTKVS